MHQTIRRPAVSLAVLLGAFASFTSLGATGCDDMSTLGGNNAQGVTGGGDDTTDAGGDDAAAGDDGGGDDDSGDDGGGNVPTDCVYKDDATFCACLKWNCGGITATEKNGAPHPIYCGACSADQYCQADPNIGGVGVCGGTNPIKYKFQKEKIDVLVSIGENDNTKINYDYAANIGDGRGYTVGKVGFCTGTGDFVLVAACYNDLKPGNVLSKYWGHKDASGKSIDGLIYYNDAFINSNYTNQAETTKIDSLGDFVTDVATAAAEPDGIFNGCQDAMADALYLSPAARHMTEKGFQGALTVGFLYDTELNFGEDDDSTLLGAKSVIALADKDYGAGLPTDFTGKPFEESKWLGYFIKERVKVMAADATWKKAIDQNATWEAARRLHTGTAATESATKLDMDFDFASKYKAGATVSGAPCWTGLASSIDSKATIFVVSTDKTASATDETMWKAKAASGGTAFAACPTNPTP